MTDFQLLQMYIFHNDMIFTMNVSVWYGGKEFFTDLLCLFLILWITHVNPLHCDTLCIMDDDLT